MDSAIYGLEYGLRIGGLSSLTLLSIETFKQCTLAREYVYGFKQVFDTIK